MLCEVADFTFPLLADVYYPIVTQGDLGEVKKQWLIDKTIACSLSYAGLKAKEEVTPNVNITHSSVLYGRTKNDIRVSERQEATSITNIVITNIRDSSGNPIYVETAGVRIGKSSIFEIATNEPYVGPFGGIEYYKLVVRRSENQVSTI
jgi:hypothetical protein